MYIAMVVIEFAYMISIPVENIVVKNEPITTLLFDYITASSVYLIAIIVATLLFIQQLFIFIYG